MTEEHRLPWSTKRIARLGFLVGLGWDSKRVAGDPIIAATQNNVFQQVHRCDLGFRTAATMAWALPPDANGHFEAAAAKRDITREALIRALLIEIAGDPVLIDNILDDGVRV